MKINKFIASTLAVVILAGPALGIPLTGVTCIGGKQLNITNSTLTGIQYYIYQSIGGAYYASAYLNNYACGVGNEASPSVTSIGSLAEAARSFDDAMRFGLN